MHRGRCGAGTLAPRLRFPITTMLASTADRIASHSRASASSLPAAPVRGAWVWSSSRHTGRGTSARHPCRSVDREASAAAASVSVDLEVVPLSPQQEEERSSRHVSTIDESQVATRFIAETLLPTKHGNFRLRGYKHSVSRTPREPRGSRGRGHAPLVTPPTLLVAAPQPLRHVNNPSSCPSAGGRWSYLHRAHRDPHGGRERARGCKRPCSELARRCVRLMHRSSAGALDQRAPVADPLPRCCRRCLSGCTMPASPRVSASAGGGAGRAQRLAMQLVLS